MKTHELLHQYLLKYKNLSLHGIGNLTLIEDKTNSDSENIATKIVFNFDPKTQEDPELVKYISEVTGKMHTLAAADLEDYLLDARQLLNISKSVYLEGIGTLQKNQYGEIDFQPTTQENDAAYKDIKSMFSKYQKKSNLSEVSETSRKRIFGFLIFSGVAILIWLTIFVIRNSNFFENQPKNEKIEVAVTDTSKTIIDTTQQLTTENNTHGNLDNVKETFRVVLEISTRNRAIKRFADLKEWGHNVAMTTKDSMKFKIFMPFKAPLKDTSYYRDSLSSFFGRKVWIETLK